MSSASAAKNVELDVKDKDFESQNADFKGLYQVDGAGNLVEERHVNIAEMIEKTKRDIE